MNANFSASPEAGSLVVAVVGLWTLALLVLIWVCGRVERARRTRRAIDLRTQRALRRAGLRTALSPAPLCVLRVPDAWMGSGVAARARALGIDELTIDEYAADSQRVM